MKREYWKYNASPDVIDTILSDNEATLIHSKSKLSYSLNHTGTRVWCLLKDGIPIPEIVARMHQELEVDLDRAEQDVRHFIEDLISLQLIEPVND